MKLEKVFKELKDRELKNREEKRRSKIEELIFKLIIVSIYDINKSEPIKMMKKRMLKKTFGIIG